MEFQQQFRFKYNKYPFSLKRVKETKWWPHFVNFCQKSKLPDKSEKKFIQKIFEDWNDANGILYPFVLVQKYGYDEEKDFIELSNIQVQQPLSEDKYCTVTLEKCANWCKINGVTENKLKTFMENEQIQFLADRGYFYTPMFLFSKKFVDRHGITEEENLKKSSLRAFRKSVYEKLKEALGDDFID